MITAPIGSRTNYYPTLSWEKLSGCLYLNGMASQCVHTHDFIVLPIPDGEESHHALPLPIDLCRLIHLHPRAEEPATRKTR